MTSPLCVATGGWCRRVFHYRPPTPMYRNSPPLCTIVLQIPSLMPLKMRKVQIRRCMETGMSPGVGVSRVSGDDGMVVSSGVEKLAGNGVVAARGPGVSVGTALGVSACSVSCVVDPVLTAGSTSGVACYPLVRGTSADGVVGVAGQGLTPRLLAGLDGRQYHF